MKVIKPEIAGLMIIKPDIFTDNRGYFFESYNLEKYTEIGINKIFVQDNQSKSKKGTIRGLHYQIGKSAQAKLVSVSIGKILDIAVDIRFGSPTFGKYVGIELSSDNNLQFWIPEGFAHGFCSLEDINIVQYKCTAFYSKKDERGILYNDSDIGINWKINNPIVSKKDLNNLLFCNIEKDFIYKS